MKITIPHHTYKMVIILKDDKISWGEYGKEKYCYSQKEFELAIIPKNEHEGSLNTNT